jgi:WD40 repeat protein
MMTSEPNVSTTLSGSFYITGGTLPTNAPSYVARRADDDLLQSLYAGEFCYVLNTRQMGKSSLMIRTARELRQRGCTVAVLDLTAVGQNLTPAQWYAGLLSSLAEQVGLEDELEDYWEEQTQVGPLQRFLTAVRQIVLPTVVRSLIIFVDEIDAVRSLPFSADEFFAAIRECYNRRTRDDVYNKLAFCLIGVATPADLITDTRLSPFNIGQRIELADFTWEETVPLAQGVSGGVELLRRVYHWTNGHPYMTQRLCRAIADSQSPVTLAEVDTICERLFLTKQARDSDDNLAFVRNRLLRSEVDLASLLHLYQQIRTGKRVKDDETNSLIPVLRLSGVIAVKDGYLCGRNRIYDRVFDKDWVLAHLPDAEIRRQRDAFRRGVYRTAAAAAVLIILMGCLTAEAIHEYAIARVSEKAAKLAENNAQIEAFHAKFARLSAEQQRQVADAQRALAERQTLVALAAEQKARGEAQLAQNQTSEAIRDKLLAESATASERAAHVQTSHLLDVSNLQLAGQLWDSDTGSAQEVGNLLAASRTPGPNPQRFEWRYQWNLLNRSSAASMTVSDRAGVFGMTMGGGYLDVLGLRDGLFRLHIADGKMTRIDLSKLVPEYRLAGLSEDGTEIAISRYNGEIEVRDTKTMQIISAWSVGPSSASMDYIYFLNNGRTVVTESNYESYVSYDVRTGTELAKWDGSDDGGVHGSGNPAQFSDDGRFRAVGNVPAGGEISLYDLTKVEQPGYKPTVFVTDASVIGRIKLSDDGNILAAGDPNGVIYIWNTRNGSLEQRWRAQSSKISNVTLNAEGSEVAIGSEDGVIRLWDLLSNPPTLVDTLKGSRAPVWLIFFSRDSHYLASYASNATALAWNLDDHGLQTLAMSQHQNKSIVHLVFTPDGKDLLAVLGDGGSVDWNTADWHLREDSLFQSTNGNANTLLLSTAFSPDNSTVATFGVEPMYRSRDKPLWAWQTPGKYYLQLWNLRSGRPDSRWDSATIFDGNTPGPMYGGATTLAFSPDGHTIVGGFGTPGHFIPDYNQVLAVWDTKTGQLTHKINGLQNSVSSAIFSPDGSTLYVGCYDGNVYRFDTRTWQQRARVECGSPIMSMALSSDGLTLASGDQTGNIRLWSTQTWLTPRILSGHTAGVTDLAFSPDNLTLASSGLDQRVILWDALSGRLTRALPTHADYVEALAFSPNSTVLASADAGGYVRLWNAASQTEIDQWERNPIHARPAQTLVKSEWVTPQDEQTAEVKLMLEVKEHRVPAYDQPITTNNLLSPLVGSQQMTLFVQPGLGNDASSNALPNGGIHVRVYNTHGIDWEIQLLHPGLPLVTGKRYVFQFRARADSSESINTWSQRDMSPWDKSGFYLPIELGPQWQAYRIRFVMGPISAKHSEVDFNLGYSPNTYSFSDLVLVPDIAQMNSDIRPFVWSERAQ